MTDSRPAPAGGFSPTSMLLEAIGHRWLDWDPDGAVLVELPNGRQVRLGREGDPDEITLRLNNTRILWKAMRRGTLGFAEAYLDGDIECSDLTALFRFFVRNREKFKRSGKGLFRSRMGERFAHLMRANTRGGSRRNITEHYDLGNDFFSKWLDQEMVYSSAYYETGAKDLDHAQIEKLKLIADFLDLEGGEEVLEIGFGWGAMARYLARDHDAHVTGITLSHEQHALSQALAEERQLSQHCTFKLEDYRDTRGQFDRIVSIEMIEAVGEQYWPRYFRTLADRLRAGGNAVIQAITIREETFEAYRRTPDFIQRYIFPGGMLPTISGIKDQARAVGLTLDRAERFGKSYAETLREWRRRFEDAWPQIEKLGFDERFRRRWRYYLCYCEAGFEEGVIDVGAYRLRKPA